MFGFESGFLLQTAKPPAVCCETWLFDMYRMYLLMAYLQSLSNCVLQSPMDLNMTLDLFE